MITFNRYWNKLKFNTDNLLYSIGSKCEHSGTKVVQRNVHADGSITGYNDKPPRL